MEYEKIHSSRLKKKKERKTINWTGGGGTENMANWTGGEGQKVGGGGGERLVRGTQMHATVTCKGRLDYHRSQFFNLCQGCTPRVYMTRDVYPRHRKFYFHNDNTKMPQYYCDCVCQFIICFMISL